MATIGYETLPVPAGGDGPDVPAWLADMATAVDPHLVHDVTNLADRNSRFAGAPLCTLCVAADGTTWVKTSASANTWVTLWEPLPAWQPVTLATGYTASGGYTPQARLIGKRVYLRGRIERSDGQVVPNQGVKVGSVPSTCIPQVQIGAWAATGSLAGDVTIGVGKLEVLEVGSASALGVAGDITWWSQDGATAGGTPWIAINGAYWID
ncbi:hypothetical protein [Streptomyces youssoufiensis]